MATRKISALTGIFLAVVACGSGEDTVGSPSPEHQHAEAAEIEAARATELSIVLRLDIGPGHFVAFHEPAPGGLFIVETTAPGQKAIVSDLQNPDALEVFKQLRPGEAVPAALLDAYQRAQVLEASEAALTGDVAQRSGGGGSPAIPLPAGVTSRGDGTASTQQAHSTSSAQHFVGVHGGCDWGAAFSFCRVEWGGGFFAFSTGNSMTCVVDHYAGNGVTVQATLGATVLPSFQAAGTIQTYVFGVVGGAINRRLDILNAAGDLFHVGCRWN